MLVGGEETGLVTTR
jgi:hypothetical protein